MKLKQGLIQFFLFLLIGLFAILFYLALPFLSPDKPQSMAVPEENCDLHNSACRSFFNQNQFVELSIHPQGLPLLTPLKLTVKLNHIQAKKIHIEIEGLNMDMGFNRAVLIQQADQSYQGVTTLPSCMMNKMQWQARVIIETGHDSWVAPFYFQTTKK